MLHPSGKIIAYENGKKYYNAIDDIELNLAKYVEGIQYTYSYRHKALIMQGDTTLIIFDIKNKQIQHTNHVGQIEKPQTDRERRLSDQVMKFPLITENDHIRLFYVDDYQYESMEE